MPSIHDPLSLPSGQVLNNRFMKSALSEALGDSQNRPTLGLYRLYERWSTGGFGLIVTGNVMIDRDQLGEPGNVVIEDDRDLKSLTTWASAGKQAGSAMWMQINHPGRQANALSTRHRPVAPSPIAAKVPGAVRPRELNEPEIVDLIGRFAQAAAVAEAAGFDGVQVHGAHGYLVSQFLSPRSNQRDDAWGGDPERRMRFVQEVISAIRAQVSPDFGVGIKLNSADFQRGGFTEEESQDVVGQLVADGVDLIEISGGSYESPAMMGMRAESTRAREAYFLEYAAQVRKIAQDVPLAVTGGFRSRAAMEQAIADEECDVVGLGRPTCTNPDAAADILASRVDRLADPKIQVGARAAVGKVVSLKTLDSALDLQWHTDQLHRIGSGKQPDIDRPWWRTAATAVQRNGLRAFSRKRS